ncbi:MAG: PAS domain-containing protein, partial [Anaerolineae bacterium]|nr:PAS domain-containing protein [Anaerolineae bacterium]
MERPANWLGNLVRATERLFSRTYRSAGESPSAGAANIDAVTLRAGAILKSLAEGVVVQDLGGRIVMMNDAAKKLLGSQKAFWNSPLARLSAMYRHVTQLDDELQQLGEPARVEVNDRILGATAAAVAT